MLNHDPVVQLFVKEHPDTATTFRQISATQEDIAARAQVSRDISGGRRPTHHNLILFVVDALRADHLPAYGYERPIMPFLSGLIRDRGGRTIPMVLSNGTETDAALPELFLSKNFSEISTTNYSLVDFLEDRGFQVRFFMSGNHQKTLGIIAHQKWLRNDLKIQDGTSNRDPAIYDIDDDEALLKLVQELPQDDGNDHFFYFHLMSVHQLGAFHNTFKKYVPALNMSPLPWERLGPGDVPAVVNLYDDRILQADDYLDRIMTDLGRKGYLRDYAAVITSDHGQLLGEHGEFAHGSPRIFLESIHIPMVLFGSDPLPPIPNSFGLQIDIAPTLLGMMGLKKPESWRGESLLEKQGERWGLHYDPAQSAQQEMAVTYWHQGTLWKYTRKTHGSGSGADERLANLTKDPGEKMNLVSLESPEFVDRFRDFLAEQTNPK